MDIEVFGSVGSESSSNSGFNHVLFLSTHILLAFCYLVLLTVAFIVFVLKIYRRWQDNNKKKEEQNRVNAQVPFKSTFKTNVVVCSFVSFLFILIFFIPVYL